MGGRGRKGDEPSASALTGRNAEVFCEVVVLIWLEPVQQELLHDTTTAREVFRLYRSILNLVTYII